MDKVNTLHNAHTAVKHRDRLENNPTILSINTQEQQKIVLNWNDIDVRGTGIQLIALSLRQKCRVCDPMFQI